MPIKLMPFPWDNKADVDQETLDKLKADIKRRNTEINGNDISTA
jgi:hypothetical protein